MSRRVGLVWGSRLGRFIKNFVCSRKGFRVFSCSFSVWRIREALSRYSRVDFSRGDMR